MPIFISAAIILYYEGSHCHLWLPFLCLNKLLIFIHTKQYIMAKIEIKDLKGFPDYYAGTDGLIYSTKISKRYNYNGELRILKPRTHPSGYLYYGLFVGIGPNKQRLWRRGHRLIAETFIGRIPKGKVINHKDFDKHNNHPSNLEIVTSSENSIHYHQNKIAK